MSLTNYNKYKNSGIDWLGNIPDIWRLKRIKDLTATKSGTTPATNVVSFYENGKHNWIRTTDLNNSELFDTEYKLTDLAIEKCRLSFMPIDTVLVAMYGGFGTIGKNAIVKKSSTINQSVCAILPNEKNFSSNYLIYFLKFFRNDWRLFADGTRKDPNINQDAVKNLFIIYPPMPEQFAIANYLDKKTSSIDKKISLLQQKTTHYKDLRKSLINETISRGLNKNVKFKNSGIEWIGMIPENWRVQRLKELGNIETSSINKKIEENEELFKLVNYTDVYGNKNKELRNNENYMVVSANSKQALSKVLKMGDVLFTPSSETIEDIGVSAVVMENLTNTLYSYHILRFRFSKFLDLNYKKYLFNNSFVQYYFSKSASGTTRKILGLNAFNNLPIFYPIDIKEQTEIAKFLDEKTQKIDIILTNIASQIETLKELRKTLINDVVCGKLKVTADD